MNAIVLAAGKGNRMKSDIPKVLHILAGKTLIDRVLDNVYKSGIDTIAVVVGFMKDTLIQQLSERPEFPKMSIAFQKQLLGTADAVKCALPAMPSKGTVLVLCGDVPLISPKTIKRLINYHKETSAAATILTAIMDNPKQYGRIIRADDGSVISIVEYKDATENQKKIKEINSGTYAFELEHLRSALNMVRTDNVQQEYYLTDVIKILRTKAHRISALIVENSIEVEGVNSFEQLMTLEKYCIQIGN